LLELARGYREIELSLQMISKHLIKGLEISPQCLTNNLERWFRVRRIRAKEHRKWSLSLACVAVTTN
jgi:hypothetical protein